MTPDQMAHIAKGPKRDPAQRGWIATEIACPQTGEVWGHLLTQCYGRKPDAGEYAKPGCELFLVPGPGCGSGPVPVRELVWVRYESDRFVACDQAE